jgi:hypothetical protein
MQLVQLARDLGHAARAAFAITPKGAAGAARLDAYWTEGEGAAKIRWAEPCAFCRCLTELGKHLEPARLKGHCANLEKRATGHYPNAGHSKTKHCPC